jgi:hypothetical protein
VLQVSQVSKKTSDLRCRVPAYMQHLIQIELNE